MIPFFFFNNKKNPSYQITLTFEYLVASTQGVSGKAIKLPVSQIIDEKSVLGFPFQSSSVFQSCLIFIPSLNTLMYPEGNISNDNCHGMWNTVLCKSSGFQGTFKKQSRSTYPVSSAVSQAVLLASERDVKKCHSFLVELYALQMFQVEKFCDYLSPKKPHGVTLYGGIHQTLLMGHTIGLILRVSLHGTDM